MWPKCYKRQAMLRFMQLILDLPNDLFYLFSQRVFHCDVHLLMQHRGPKQSYMHCGFALSQKKKTYIITYLMTISNREIVSKTGYLD